jgi:hypothetical protein
MDKNEKVLCAFERSRSNPVTLPLCPYVESALRLVAQYKHDELDFLVRLKEDKAISLASH